MRTAKYKWLLFDADNTLLDFDRAEHDALTEALTDMGITADESLIGTYSAINDSLWKQLEKGAITKESLKTRRFELLGEHFGLDINAVAMADSYLHHLTSKNYLYPGALELCRALYGKYDFYIITNGIKSVQTGRFGTCALKDMFLGSFISEEIGAEKPSRRYFDYIAERIPGFDRTAALVIGDSLSSDIAGGINAGIDTCWFNRKNITSPSGWNITYTVTELSQIPGLIGE